MEEDYTQDLSDSHLVTGWVILGISYLFAVAVGYWGAEEKWWQALIAAFFFLLLGRTGVDELKEAHYFDRP